jgi:hypothetical protein
LSLKKLKGVLLSSQHKWGSTCVGLDKYRDIYLLHLFQGVPTCALATLEHDYMIVML